MLITAYQTVEKKTMLYITSNFISFTKIIIIVDKYSLKSMFSLISKIDLLIYILKMKLVYFVTKIDSLKL